MVRVGDINPLDRRFWPDNPEPGFSPERNKQVVNKSIAKYELMRRKKQEQFGEQLKERTDAVAYYLTSNKGATSKNSLERYFGRRYLAHLRGEDIVDELRERLKFVGVPTPPKIYDSKGRLLGKSVQQKKKNKMAQ